jgi:phosphoadenosine phosphosulfate reductase
MSSRRAGLRRIAVHREPQQVLEAAVEAYPRGLRLVTSLGPQTLVALDILHKMGAEVPVLMLDTGLLFDETLTLHHQVQERYGVEVRRVRPEATVRQQAGQEGDALWLRDADRCCHLRKVLPLAAALEGAEAWVTGLRRDQSASRRDVQTAMWDVRHELVKVCPFAWWSRAQVFGYLLAHDVPFNPLLEQGYPSVGCTPCTRALTSDDLEGERAGRWAGSQKTECGLHLPLEVLS